ncbi:putative hydrolase of the HAD superfamily [Algoriphagus ratkowskyi]|uniref:HAD family hydrolase n=1 Tax=Algoriphagus ratkowskyi TaxID=57028 RepID=A0A2W7QXY9_9BACT|nr:HAD family hydrolase [Algoriphagus ratkowskyi]PZX53134.1 putative hydrolase of the HAD superfamily [Algoriphagus ratkowskyi]TXD76412.1 HAD family hydrolase [Algoriphagus ratkowskyi]
MIKVIAFDADDTLWVNEPFFREAEEEFAKLMEPFMPRHSVIKEVYQTEIDNLGRYGYGIKGFILSMIQTALRISDHKIPVTFIDKILEIGFEMMEKPVEILPGVEEVLAELQNDYRLVMATKGDLVDQEKKLKKSGLDHYFHHIEIMSEKKEADFAKLVRHLDVHPAEFLMMGNSLKSDVLPVLELGGHAIHIPFHTTWAHEMIQHEVEHDNFRQAEHIAQVVKMIKEM